MYLIYVKIKFDNYLIYLMYLIYVKIKFDNYLMYLIYVLFFSQCVRSIQYKKKKKKKEEKKVICQTQIYLFVKVVSKLATIRL